MAKEKINEEQLENVSGGMGIARAASGLGEDWGTDRKAIHKAVNDLNASPMNAGANKNGVRNGIKNGRVTE